MDEEFDPSDQFFHAYRAGFLDGWDASETLDIFSPDSEWSPVWDRYLAWPYEDGVTT